MAILDRNLARTALVLWLGMGAACGDDSDDTNMNVGGNEQAADAYYVGAASMALGASTNEADCALCHSDDGTQERLPGKTFKDVAYKESWKGGDAPTLLAAANACVTGWMGGTALSEEDPEWKSLEAYLQSLSDEGASEPNAIMPEVLADEAAYEEAYADGDAAAGEAKFNDACGACHGTQLTVGMRPAWALDALKAQSVGRIAQKVRTSGPPPSGTDDAMDSTPGPMPFFEPGDLASDDLRDIIAYIKQN